MLKKLPALGFTLLLTFSLSAQTITPLYLNFNSHSEENDFGFGKNYNNNVDTFNKYRNLLVTMCDTFRAKGAKYNSQHDWAFLEGAKLYDNGSHANTNNKNIFQWMRDDNNGLIELDAHAHMTQKNYTDVVWYYQQLGITPSKVVGGFLYDTVMNAAMPGSNWTQMQDSLPGKTRPFMKFQFDILWGGGTGNHQGVDLSPVGIWQPDTMKNILTHNGSRHLVLLGNGCNTLLTDTTANIVSTLLNEIRTLVYEINNGQLAAGKFYSSCIMFNIRDLRPGLAVKAAQLIDSLQPLVDAGYIVWKNHTEKVDIWKAQYTSAPNIVICADMPAWERTNRNFYRHTGFGYADFRI
ncbi:MAG: hypothetical protein IPH78_01480 [Bacteroidetes bacterium]|nr:hypothetical protein [Bacteroidota bacterium]